MTTENNHGLEPEPAPLSDQSRADGVTRVRRVCRGPAAMAATALAGVILAGCGPANDSGPVPEPSAPSPAVTVSDLAGVWRLDSAGRDGWLWAFTDRGMLTGKTAGELFTDEAGHPVSEIPGGFAITGGQPGCTTGFAASISPEGRMRATVISNEPKASCDQDLGDALDLTRLSPRSTAGDRISSFWTTTEPRKVDGLAPLVGTWLLRGTGTLLSVTGTAYTAHDVGGSADPQNGAMEVRPDGSVVFTPSGAQGCSVVYELVTTRASTLEAQVASGSCARFGTGTIDTWIKLN